MDDASDPSLLLAGEVSRKARDLIEWYTTMPDMMCLLEEDGRTIYSPVPTTPSSASHIERVLRAARSANTAGVAIAHLARTLSDDCDSIEVLVVLAFASEIAYVEVTPIAREGGITFGIPWTFECDIVKVPTMGSGYVAKDVTVWCPPRTPGLMGS
jgi:hypothetical protein